MAVRGYDVENPSYFPSIGEYTSKLESHSFETRYATLLNRPTELNNGIDGLAEWLAMFGDSILAAIPDDEQSAIISSVEDQLREE